MHFFKELNKVMGKTKLESYSDFDSDEAVLLRSKSYIDRKPSKSNQQNKQENTQIMTTL